MRKTMMLCLLFSISLVQAKEIETIKVKDNLYMVGDRTYSLFYITKTVVVVIDPIDENHAKATMIAIKKVTNLPVTNVFYSHNHWDHISGGKIFKEQGAVIISHIKAKQHISENEKVIIPDKIWDGNFTTYVIGGKTITLYFFGRNHGDGMTIFRFPEHNIVLTIDLVVPDRVLYAYLPDANPSNWVTSLQKIDELDFDILLMSHVRAVGTRKDLHLVQNYFNDLYTAVQKELDAGTNLFEIPHKIQLPKYKHWMNYKEWLPMNAWRILMEKFIGQ
uniref:MBL fold metallo-hydrolase n=1 Tax=Zhouia sp. PK063 TaxID=3373602 RepID=UPI0037DCCBB6